MKILKFFRKIFEYPDRFLNFLRNTRENNKPVFFGWLFIINLCVYFIINSLAPGKPFKPIQHEFSTYVRYVISNEGGYVNDPADKGGETKFGISKKSHPDIDIKNLTEEKAIAIYRTKYWRDIYYSIEDENVRVKLFDMSILMGGYNAILCLQHACDACGVDVKRDGVLNKRLVDKVNSIQTKNQLFYAYRASLASFFYYLANRNPSQAKFLEGWLQRATEDIDYGLNTQNN
jgi:lysozyme family protein